MNKIDNLMVRPKRCIKCQRRLDKKVRSYNKSGCNSCHIKIVMTLFLILSFIAMGIFFIDNDKYLKHYNNLDEAEINFSVNKTYPLLEEEYIEVFYMLDKDLCNQVECAEGYVCYECSRGERK